MCMREKYLSLRAILPFLMRKSFFLLSLSLLTLPLWGVTKEGRFVFQGSGFRSPDALLVTDTTFITPASDYGWEHPSAGQRPTLFSIRVPDGNYRVTVVFGNKRRSTCTTLKAESRRLIAEEVRTRKGEQIQQTFVIHKHSPAYGEDRQVRLNARERYKLDWDDRLTLEIGGDEAGLHTVTVLPDTTSTTVFLCGNSTVVDQDSEPWCSWGQILPRWMDDSVTIANFAESGETASGFIAEGRLAKAMTMARPGDYLVVEFGHNDQKQRGPGMGAYYNFAVAVKTFIDEARSRGITPILVTPTRRRAWQDGVLIDTHADYPQALHDIAQRERVCLLDLQEQTRILYTALGEEGSTRAFVHYPAGTFAHQPQALKDNTHFNPYGAYEIAKCVVEEMRRAGLPLCSHLRDDYKPFDPTHPDDPDTFRWLPSPFVDVTKPLGN